MEIISTAKLGNNTLNLVDLAGRNGGKWKIARVFRVVETEGQYVRLNASNVINDHYWIKYNGRSKKDRNLALCKAIDMFAETLKDHN